jgi:AraC-like DNA-binding protein
MVSQSPRLRNKRILFFPHQEQNVSGVRRPFFGPPGLIVTRDLFFGWRTARVRAAEPIAAFRKNMKSNGSYALHLTVREASLPAGAEWSSDCSGWLLVQVEGGSGYWIHARQNVELDPGTVLVLPPNSDGTILASQIGNLSFCFFSVEPMRLMGLMTLAEQSFFQAGTFHAKFPARFVAADQPLAVKLQKLFETRKQMGSLLRLQLLQIFIEVFGKDLEPAAAGPGPVTDAKERLSEFLKTTQASKLINLSFTELVDVSRCTPRHLSRIFREVVGMSFRDKQAELRLSLACDLLASTELKIVDVALESGFQSLSLFNLMFRRHFEMSPGRWRQKYREIKPAGARAPRKAASFASAF